MVFSWTLKISISLWSAEFSRIEGEDTLPCVRQFHLPVAALCPRRTRIDRVAVVDALADGEALDDLDAHYEYEAGLLFPSGLLTRLLSKRGVVDGSLAVSRLQERLERSTGRKE
jgi:hypothetical protein